MNESESWVDVIENKTGVDTSTPAIRFPSHFGTTAIWIFPYLSNSTNDRRRQLLRNGDEGGVYTLIDL